MMALVKTTALILVMTTAMMHRSYDSNVGDDDNDDNDDKHNKD